MQITFIFNGRSKSKKVPDAMKIARAHGATIVNGKQKVPFTSPHDEETHYWRKGNSSKPAR